MTVSPGPGSGARRLAVACAFIATACAGRAGGGGGGRPATVSPADQSALETQRSQHPTDPDVNLRLARAYYAAQRYADARRALQIVLVAQPGNASARAYLGLTYEGLEQYDSARAVYTRLLFDQPPPGRPVRRLLDGRLALLTRKELQQRARLAIARESLLVRTPPDPNTIAVMPFRYTGADSSLRPLERGLAALVVTDLSRVRRLSLVGAGEPAGAPRELRAGAGGRGGPAARRPPRAPRGRGPGARARGASAAPPRAFRAAARRDPGFRAAARGAQTSQAAQPAPAAPPGGGAGRVGGGGGGGGGEAPPSPNQGTLTNAINNAVPSGAANVTATPTSGGIQLPPTDPNRICEGASCDGPARAALVGTIIIIIRRP